MLVVGYLTAVVLPFVGLIVGLIVSIRRRSLHGFAIIAISLVAGFAFLSLSDDDGGSMSPEIERQYQRIGRCFDRELPHADVDTVVETCEERVFR